MDTFRLAEEMWVDQEKDGACMDRLIQGDTKKRELLKNATKIEEIQEKKFFDRN